MTGFRKPRSRESLSLSERQLVGACQHEALARHPHHVAAVVLYVKTVGNFHGIGLLARVCGGRVAALRVADIFRESVVRLEREPMPLFMGDFRDTRLIVLIADALRLHQQKPVLEGRTGIDDRVSVVRNGVGRGARRNLVPVYGDGKMVGALAGVAQPDHRVGCQFPFHGQVPLR